MKRKVSRTKRKLTVRFTSKHRYERPRRHDESFLEQKARQPISMAAAYDQGWKFNLAHDFVFWRFDVGYFVQENLLHGFLKRLKQVQLLNFFEKTCEVIVPRLLMVDFILRCKLEKVFDGRRRLTYNLQMKNAKTLSIDLTRKSFAELLKLPVVENKGESLDYSSYGFADNLEWLGEEYIGSMCNCSNCKERTRRDGLSNCPSCSLKVPESFWIADEIKDPSVRDLSRFIGVWIHNTNDSTCLRRAAVASLNEALISEAGMQIWTQHLWTNFLWDLEKMKGHTEQSKPYECHFSTAGLISTLICAHVRKSHFWIPALRAWESSTFTPGMKTCKLLLKQLRKSEGDMEGRSEESLQVYQRRKNMYKVYVRRSASDAKIARIS